MKTLALDSKSVVELGNDGIVKALEADRVSVMGAVDSEVAMMKKAGEMAREAVNTDEWKFVPASVRAEVYAKAKKQYFGELKEGVRADRVRELICLIEDLDSVEDSEVLADLRSQLMEIAKGRDFNFVFVVEKKGGDRWAVRYNGSVLESISSTGMGAKVMPFAVFVHRYNCSVEKVCRDKFNGVLDVEANDGVELFKMYEAAVVRESADGLIEQVDELGKSGWDGKGSKRGNFLAKDLFINKIQTKAAGLALRMEKKAVSKAIKSGVEWYGIK